MSFGMNIQGGGAIGKKPKLPEAAPKSLGSSVKRLMAYMKKSQLLIGLTLIIAIAGTVMQVLVPKLLGGATTVIFEGLQNQTGIDMVALLIVLMIVGALYLGVFLATFLQERLMTIVSLRTTETLRNAVKEKLNKIPVAYFDKTSTGDLMSIAINDIDNVAQNLQQSLTQLISTIILVGGIFTIMLTISPLLTLVACIILPVITLITKAFTPLTKTYNQKYFGNMGELNGSIEEAYNNFVIIKSFNGEEDTLTSFRKFNDSLCELGWRAKFFGQSMMHLMMLVQNSIYVLLAVWGAVQVLGGMLLIGNLQAFLQYSQQFSSPIAKLSGIWSNLLSVVTSAERVFAILDTDEMVEYDTPFEVQPDDAKVVFDNVQFGYGENTLMSNFNLTVDNGQMIAIVGHTGAGKTTLVNLLERFYEIQDGSIRIDGSDIRSTSYNNLRQRLGIVLQDTWLFSGTIYANIKYGNSEATDEQVFAAAKAAYADDFITKLPDGYNTVLGEDASNISGGQRQLITIARAFLANPEILILDEATSNVDSRTEMIVQKAMKKLMENRTSFVIAHRLSTIYDANRIVVMANGEVIETGTHQQLIEQDGTYADIYNSQFKQSVA